MVYRWQGDARWTLKRNTGGVGAGVTALGIGGACIAGGVITGAAGTVIGPEGTVLGAAAGCLVTGAAAIVPSTIVGALVGTGYFLSSLF